MNQNLLINNLIKAENKNQELLKNILLVLSGTIFLALMSQLSITLPFTPVPITGQTFAVMFIGLVYGRKLGSATVLHILRQVLQDFQFLQDFQEDLTFFTPSGGYIIGFFFAVLVCGYFADKGWTKSPVKLISLLIAAHAALYFFGLLQLSVFLPIKNVFAIGLYPFIAGDVIKNDDSFSIITYSLEVFQKII